MNIILCREIGNNEVKISWTNVDFNESILPLVLLGQEGQVDPGKSGGLFTCITFTMCAMIKIKHDTHMDTYT